MYVNWCNIHGKDITRKNSIAFPFEQKNLTQVKKGTFYNFSCRFLNPNILSHHLRKIVMMQSMARANLNKSEELVTNTTAASKYIPRSSRICINWNPPFQTSLHKFFKNCFLWSKSYFTTLTLRGTFSFTK